MSGHSKWKEIKRKGPVSFIITPKEYEVGQIIRFRNEPHVILDKDRYPRHDGGHQWSYEVLRLPENPMTEEDMKDISS